MYWLHVLPPALVDRAGRDQLLAAPAWRVEALSDGAVLLVVDDLPDVGDGTNNRESVLDHLGVDGDPYRPG